MEKPLLKDETIFPSNEVLKDVLSEGAYIAYQDFFKKIVEGCGLDFEWRFYKDGNVWLGKVTFKKKTILWFSVWDGYFKTGFFFNEKTMHGVFDLEISQHLKEELANAKFAGKLITLAISVDNSEVIDDIAKLVEYKKKLK